MRSPSLFTRPLPAFWLAAGLFGFCLRVLLAAPTAEQQFMLEMINRMRTNPAAELDFLVNMSAPGTWDSPKSDHATVAAALEFYGVSASALTTQWAGLSPTAPLAWNDSLSSAAANYSNVMVNADQQAHGLDGLSLQQRITSTGYTNQLLEIGESVFAKAVDASHAHAALAIDWGPDGGSGTGIQPGATHRAALMDPFFKEIGIGFQTITIPIGNTEADGPMVLTEHFATSYRSNSVNLISDAILTGVIYEDSITANSFYTPGEGISGALVFVYDNVTNALVASGQTNSVGGFNITLTGLVDGITYRIEAPGTGEPAQTFSLDKRVELYPTQTTPVEVTLYDNVYASFATVPEPASIWLILCACLPALKRRRL
jgi:hypothetical protein